MATRESRRSARRTLLLVTAPRRGARPRRARRRRRRRRPGGVHDGRVSRANRRIAQTFDPSTLFGALVNHTVVVAFYRGVGALCTGYAPEPARVAAAFADANATDDGLRSPGDATMNPLDEETSRQQRRRRRRSRHPDPGSSNKKLVFAARRRTTQATRRHLRRDQRPVRRAAPQRRMVRSRHRGAGARDQVRRISRVRAHGGVAQRPFGNGRARQTHRRRPDDGDDRCVRGGPARRRPGRVLRAVVRALQAVSQFTTSRRALFR